MKALSFMLFFVWFIPTSFAMKIKVGYFEVRPYFFFNEETQRPEGAVMSYLEKIAKENNWEIEWVGPLPLPRMIEMGKNGEIDALMALTDWARDSFLYPDKPTFELRSVFYVKKNNPLEKIQSIDAVKGYRLGFLKDAPPSVFVRSNMDKFKMEYSHSARWEKQNLQKILKNRIDASHGLNEHSLMYEAMLLGVADQIKVLFLPDPADKGYIVFAKNEKGRKILEAYNKTDKKLKIDTEKLLQDEFKKVQN